MERDHDRPLSRQSGDSTHSDVRISMSSRDALQNRPIQVPPLTITLQNLSCSVIAREDKGERSTSLIRATATSVTRLYPRQPARTKKILDNVSGVFRSGRLTAILGASGSGKTTLLNMTAGLAVVEGSSGQLFLNGHRVDGPIIRRFAGFVYQDDAILKTMAVREALMTSMQLRFPKWPPAQQRQRVDEILAALGLHRVANAMVGSPLEKRISGGERKRTAIGIELVTDPPVLFLDEPTSGLDAYMALTVAEILNRLARTGRTVVTVVHQPSSEMFHLFDDLMILSEGKVVYYGTAPASVPYFGRLGFHCPRYTNPADFFFTTVLHTNRPFAERVRMDMEKQDKERTAHLVSAWENSREYSRLMRYVYSPDRSPILAAPKPTAGFSTQCRIVLVRLLKNSWRNPMIIRTRVLQHVLLALFAGIVFMNIPRIPSVTAQIQTYIGIFFFISVNIMFTSTTSVVTIFGEEKLVFLREQSNGYYTTSSYFLSKILEELPYQTFCSILFACILYWMVGLRPEFSRFLFFTATIVLLTFTGTALGIWTASMFDVAVGVLVIPLFILPLLVFGGLFINLENAPVWLSWIQWISPIQYSFSALAQNQFRGFTFPNGVDGRTALQQLGIDRAFPRGVNLLFLGTICLTFILAAYISLLQMARKTSQSASRTERRLRRLLQRANKES